MLSPNSPLFPEWFSMGLVLLTLGSLILGLREYQKRYSPHPELVRKFLHIGMGLVTLSFPWLFTSPLPVILLASLSVALLVSIQGFKPLQKRLGSVTHGVKRESLGEVYFPLSVALLFVLSDRNVIFFGIPMLILALADAVAALIGVRYGLLQYTTSEGKKSAEGSIAFFTVAFLATHIPLLLLTETGRAETLLISLTLGLLVMLIEAIAWRGLDNLFIPLGGFILLKTLLAMDVTALSWRLAATVLLVVCCICWRNHTTLNDSAVLGAAFVGYLSWTIGDWAWFVSPLVLFLSYSLLCPWTKQYPERRHDIRAVLSVASTGIFWLYLARIFYNPVLIYPYILGYAAHLVIIDLAIPVSTHQLSGRFMSVAVLKGWTLMLFPFWVAGEFSFVVTLQSILALPAIAFIALLFCWVKRFSYAREQTNLLWWLRAGIVTGGSALGLFWVY